MSPRGEIFLGVVAFMPPFPHRKRKNGAAALPARPLPSIAPTRQRRERDVPLGLAQAIDAKYGPSRDANGA